METKSPTKPTVTKNEAVIIERPLTKNQQKVLPFLEKSLGIVTTAFKNAGFNRSMHYEWLENSPAYRKAVEAIEDITIDFVESKLQEQINDGNVVATIFFLKTKGRKRGYIEKIETDVNHYLKSRPQIKFGDTSKKDATKP